MRQKEKNMIALDSTLWPMWLRLRQELERRFLLKIEAVSRGCCCCWLLSASNIDFGCNDDDGEGCKSIKERLFQSCLWKFDGVDDWQLRHWGCCCDLNEVEEVLRGGTWGTLKTGANSLENETLRDKLPKPGPLLVNFRGEAVVETDLRPAFGGLAASEDAEDDDSLQRLGNVGKCILLVDGWKTDSADPGATRCRSKIHTTFGGLIQQRSRRIPGLLTMKNRVCLENSPYIWNNWLPAPVELWQIDQSLLWDHYSFSVKPCGTFINFIGDFLV